MSIFSSVDTIASNSDKIISYLAEILIQLQSLGNSQTAILSLISQLEDNQAKSLIILQTISTDQATINANIKRLADALAPVVVGIEVVEKH